MAAVDPILDYPTPSRSPERLMLEEGADFVRAIFPVWPEWLTILYICSFAFIAVLQTILPLVMTYMLWHAIRSLGGPLPPGVNSSLSHWAFIIIRGWWGLAFIYWVWTILAWRRHWRWGRVPRVLLANREGLTLSYLGWWTMRQKHWPIQEIDSIEYRPLRTNLNWRKTVADLEIRRKKGFPKRFRLSSTDPRLPTHIANRIRSVLGHGS